MNYPLVVVYGRLSRYDKANGDAPFAGAAGDMFKHRTLDLAAASGVPVDIRVLGTADMMRPFPFGSRVLLLGEDALTIAGFTGQNLNLNKHRGYCLTVRSPVTNTQHAAIATYHPIECWDFTQVEPSDDDDDTDGGDSEKDMAATKRQNFFSWALHDFWKLLTHAQPAWKIQPLPQPAFLEATYDQIAAWINALPAGAHVTLDIECRHDFSLDVIGIRANGQAFVIPWYRWDNIMWFKSMRELGLIWRSLAKLFLRTDITIVGHNLAFDLAVLCVTLGLPLPQRLYDTMIAMHRTEPLLEKSLSHAISYYLCTPRNHKADICPNVSPNNFARLRQYNAEDLIRTEQLREAQIDRARTRPDYQTAIQQGNELLHATLMMSLTGIATDQRASDAARDAYLLHAKNMKRCCEVLTGIKDFNPASPDQVGAYFYGKLRYPVTEITDTGAPATGAKAMYSLQIAQQNPLIPLIIEFREAKKAASSLEFRRFRLPRI